MQRNTSTPPRRSWLLALLAAAFLAFPPTAAAQSYTDRVVELVNAERAQAGLAPLVSNPLLTGSAQGYAQLLAETGCFEHTCGPVPDFTDRIAGAGYVDWIAAGENLAAGQQSPEAVVAGWMNSPAHRANILNPDFAEIGVGLAEGGELGMYWTQAFGTRDPAFAFAAVVEEEAMAEPADEAQGE